MTEGQHRVSSVEPLLSNRAYDLLKRFVTIILPGIGTLYFGFGQLWDFPRVEQVVGSTAVLGTFLGLLLKASSARYDSTEFYNWEQNKMEDDRYDGNLNVVTIDGGPPEFLLTLNEEDAINRIPTQKSVTFKVNLRSS